MDVSHRWLRGFTLVELACVLAVAAILLQSVVPGMSRGLAARVLAAQVSEFMAALRFARAEAVKRGEVVTMCAADVPGARPRCVAARSADWRNGWLVFVDRGTRGALDPGDVLLRVQAPLVRTGGVAGTRAAVSFTAAGFSTDAASHYLFDPPPTGPAGPPLARLVCVSKQGRPRLVSGGTC